MYLGAMMFFTQYKNVANFPDGVYRNIDTKFPSIWVKTDGDDLRIVSDIRDLKNEKILKDIYFSASAFPHKNRLRNFYMETQQPRSQ